MSKYLDLDNWTRKEHFLLFRKYSNPFFSVCVEVDVTTLLNFSKENSLSFFLTSLYLSTKAANRIEAFRYRIQGDQVRIYPSVDAGSTVLNQDETFSFCYFDYVDDFSIFNTAAKAQLARHTDGFKDVNPRDERDDLIHYSVLPWISFKSFSHAKRFGIEDSIPKIVFGKYFQEDGKVKMPVSVEVHHALMDGIHVGKFIDTFQMYLDDPGAHLR